MIRTERPENCFRPRGRRPLEQRRRRRASAARSVTASSPMPRVFEETQFNAETVRRRRARVGLSQQGACASSFVDEREKDSRNAAAATTCYEGGLADYVQLPQHGTKRRCTETVLTLRRAYRTTCALLRVAIQHTDDSYAENIFSYVNNIPTGRGRHARNGLQGRRSPRRSTTTPAASALLKEKDNNLIGRGLTARA